MIFPNGLFFVLYSILVWGRAGSILSTSLSNEALQAAFSTLHMPPCHLGQLPGTWVEDSHMGSQYQLLTAPGSNCQIKNYLAESLLKKKQVVSEKKTAGENISMLHKTSILFLGDSVDRWAFIGCMTKARIQQ
jgi:hypothetical protein